MTWKEDLTNLFTNYDFSKFVLIVTEGKQAQFGNIKINKEIFADVNSKYPNYFTKVGELASCLLYLKKYPIEDLLSKLECPVCHEFNHTFRFNNSRNDNYFYCSKECRYSKTGYSLTMKSYKEKTGYDNPYANPEVQQKRKDNFIKNYGVTTPMELEEFKQKNINNNKLNHNGQLYVQTKEGKEQIKETNINNHNGLHNMQTKEFKERVIEKSQELFGTNYPVQAKEVRDKQIELYGGMGLASKIIREKAEATFGSPMNASNPKIFEKIKKTTEARTGLSFKEAFVQRSQKALKQKFGIKEIINPEIFKQNLLKDFACKETLKLDNFTYDFSIKSINTLISLNTKVIQSERNYHLNKTETAIKNNYKCIHIWDWDNPNKILNMFTPKQNIYARKCYIKEIDTKTCDNFLNQYHLQNTLRSNPVKLGLFYNNELIEVMTFGTPRYNKNYEYELLRLCTKSNYKVIGGASKLFKHFINTYNPTSIISYCDYSKFDGKVYCQLGMSLKEQTAPACHWCKGKQHFTDNLLRQQGADRLIGTNYGKGTNNEDILLKEGFMKIYDCGQLVFEWKI